MLLIPIIFGFIINQTQSCPGIPKTEDTPTNTTITRCNSKQTKCWFSCDSTGDKYGTRLYNVKNGQWRSNGNLKCKNGAFKSNLNSNWKCVKAERCFPPDQLLTKKVKDFQTLEENFETGHQLKLFKFIKTSVAGRDLSESGWTLVLEQGGQPLDFTMSHTAQNNPA